MLKMTIPLKAIELEPKNKITDPPPKENIAPVLAPVKLVNPPLPAVVLYELPVDFAPAAPTTAVKSSPPTTV